jgi:Transposase DDE domain group 1
LVAFLSEARRVLWAVLRSGNSRSANGCVEFLRQALTVLPAEHKVALVRADAGFFEKRFLEFLERRELPYIIVAKLTPIVRRVVLHSIAQQSWRPIGPGIEVANVERSFPSWQGKNRRFLCLRQEISQRPEARGKRLFDFPGYSYRVVVTNLTYSAEIITRMYSGRAETENRIKEFKEDLSLDGFCLQSFDATDAAFRTGCVLYNLLAGFRETVLPRSWFERRLRAVRELVFLVGADLICQGRKVKVRLALPKPDRQEFLRRLRTVSDGLPIAAQLEWSIAEASSTPSHDLIPHPPSQTSSISQGLSP